MAASERREKILERLRKQQSPVSASVLAKMLGVSRQVVVGDVAILRAGGYCIEATTRGYILREIPRECTGRFRCKPCLTEDDVRLELYAIVDNGGLVESVAIEFGLYDTICGQLNIANRYEVDRFLERARQSNDERLSLREHTAVVHCASANALARVAEALRRCGCLEEDEEMA
ncbi:MAG: HTH domain-containing protein [Gemmiger sp.]